MNSIFDPALLIPEITIALLLFIVLLLDIFVGRHQRDLIGSVTMGGLVVGLLTLVPSSMHMGMTFSGTFVNDGTAIFFKGLFMLATLYVTVMMRESRDRFQGGEGEAFLLILIATMGTMILASARDFMVLFVALETLTITMYVLTAYLKTEASSLEAGLKYLILGGLSSVLLLIGIAILYGATGFTSFGSISFAIQSGLAALPWCIAGMLLILSGVGFKVASVPFHLWVPDVYQGAPTPVTAFLSVASKAAGFVVMIRVFTEVFGPLQNRWTILLAVLAAMTVFYGNLAAIPQKNIKRLLGYSSIGHAGYLMMGMVAAPQGGLSAMSYYLLAYLFTNLCVFLVIVTFSNLSGSDSIDDYAGLSQRSPFLAAALFLALLSLAGVPPLAGFFGKFLILMSVVQSGMIWLALIGSVNVVVSLYYYLMIVKKMYVDEAKDPTPIPVSAPLKWAIASTMVGIIALGIFQAPFYQLAQRGPAVGMGASSKL